MYRIATEKNDEKIRSEIDNIAQGLKIEFKLAHLVRKINCEKAKMIKKNVYLTN